MEKHNFKPGDRVRYAADGIRDDWRGKFGIVRNITSDHVKVEWDCGEKGYVSRVGFLTPVSEVDAALAVLKKHGEVTFNPYFKPIVVKLNDVHAAIVTDKEVKVGCQTFKFEAIVRLMEAVSKAMAHR